MWRDWRLSGWKYKKKTKKTLKAIKWQIWVAKLKLQSLESIKLANQVRNLVGHVNWNFSLLLLAVGIHSIDHDFFLRED